MTRTRAAVVGSGFGGLGMAIRLQAAGIDTTLVDRRDRAGGRAYVYHDQGFVFDAGPTVITAPQALEDLFTLGGKRLQDHIEMIPCRPFYRLFWEDGYRFDYSNDDVSTLEQIRRKNPADVEGYRAFVRYAEQVFDAGYTRLAHVPFLDWWSMVRVAPQLVRLGAYRSVYDAVSRFIKDEHLRQAFSFHSLLVGGNPFSASAIYTLIHFLERHWGVYFARGGTGALVESLVTLFRGMGGEVRLGCDVDEITTRNGRVTGLRAHDGWQGEFDLVASNADVVHTYSRLLRNEPRAAGTATKLRGMRHSMSLFLIYFGTKKRYPELAHHNVIFGPRYRELLADIFDRGVLADDFSLYLHAPTVSDPSLAPEGGEAFYLLAPVPHLGKARIDWETVGPRYADRILAYLEERYLPGLRREIVCQRLFTPLDFERELNAHVGAAFSLEPLLTQSAFFRAHNRDAKIGGLYLVGAGTHPGAGVPGVLSSARASADLVLADFMPGVHSA